LVAVLHCNGLRARSLKPRRVAVSNRPTVAHQAQTTHPSPSARQFRLPFNKLAQSELRRIFCSDEGALMRIFQNAITLGCRSCRMLRP